MEWLIFITAMFFALIAGGGAYVVARRLVEAKSEIILGKAEAKARAIEHEANIIFQESKLKVKELENEAKIKHEENLATATREYQAKVEKLELHETQLKQKSERDQRLLEAEKEQLKEKEYALSMETQGLLKLKNDYASKLKEASEALSRAAGMSREEARNLAISLASEESRMRIAQIVKRYESEAKEEGRRRANFILAQATTRFAGEFAAERLINVIALPNDEFKGKIIGKEGRNIKTLETLLGVDILIDDTPGSIVLSSFNLYRRAIATHTIERLIEDGRIQPATIEETYKKVESELEEKILEDGENVVLELELGSVHPELLRLIGRLRYRASYGQNALGHSLEVANLAAIMAGELGGDVKLAKRAGILHDIGKALTYETGRSHVDLGADACRRFKEHPVVINAILAHHGHEEPRSIECAVVCAADTLSAARPGARREVMEGFLRRVHDVEAIAMEKTGVRQAYAINAGREVRIIVNAEMVSDEECALLAREIAQEIENRVQYPGEIKVSAIRETRVTEFAR